MECVKWRLWSSKQESSKYSGRMTDYRGKKRRGWGCRFFLSAVHKQESSRCISKACHWYSRPHVGRILHDNSGKALFLWHWWMCVSVHLTLSDCLEGKKECDKGRVKSTVSGSEMPQGFLLSKDCVIASVKRQINIKAFSAWILSHIHYSVRILLYFKVKHDAACTPLTCSNFLLSCHVGWMTFSCARRSLVWRRNYTS